MSAVTVAYPAPGIIFAKATDANLAVASSASGGVDADITDRINPVSLATGFISTSYGSITGTAGAMSSGDTVLAGTGTNFDPQVTPGDLLYYLSGSDYLLIGTVLTVTNDTSLTLTEEADNVPTVGASLFVNTNIITGVDTTFSTDFTAGDYLFWYDSSGSPTLIGRVSITPSSPTQLQLVSKWTTPIANKYCGGMNVIVNGAESFLVRIPVIPNGAIVNGYPTKVFLPSWDYFRITSGDSASYNNTNVSSISTYSIVGAPSEIGPTPAQVPYSLFGVNIFNTTASPTTADPTRRILWPALSQSQNAAFPNFVFALFNPFGNNQGENMAQNTMFKFLCAEELQGFIAVANTTAATMISYGYGVRQVGLGTTTDPGSES
jgi:hypothetical protein